MTRYYIEVYNENDSKNWFSEVWTEEEMKGFSEWLVQTWQEGYTVVYVDKAEFKDGYWQQPSIFDPESYRPE